MTADLTSTVDNLVHGAPATIEASATLREASTDLAGEYKGALLVTDSRRMQGIVSERDVVRAIGDGEDPDELRVADVMSEDIVTVEASATIEAAMDLMDNHEIRHLVVMDGKSFVGIISLRDVVHFLRQGETLVV